jgi:hypothetical protein
VALVDIEILRLVLLVLILLVFYFDTCSSVDILVTVVGDAMIAVFHAIIDSISFWYCSSCVGI